METRSHWYVLSSLRSDGGKANVVLNLCSGDLKNSWIQMGTVAVDWLMLLPPRRTEGVFPGQTIKFIHFTLPDNDPYCLLFKQIIIYGFLCAARNSAGQFTWINQFKP